MLVLTPELVLSAYAVGMFPMANDYNDSTIHWIEPRRRGILPLESFHIPRSLKKTIRRGEFQLKVDTAFTDVIRTCAAATPERPRTWLNPELIALYCELHRRGYAHSVETWQGGTLAGGLYGVALGGAFFGESMFSRTRDASKVALVELVYRLRAGGFALLDAQFVTEHLQQFGAIEISRADYREQLRQAITRRTRFPLAPYSFCVAALGGAPSDDGGPGSGASGSAQSFTQTS